MDKLIKSIELNALSLLSANFDLIEPDEAPKGGKLEFSCLATFHEIDENDYFDMTAKFEMHGYNGEQDLFKLELMFIATYKMLDADTFDSISEEIRVQHCLSLIYPTLRDDALRILSRAGLGSIDIPLHVSSPKICSEEELANTFEE